MRPNKSHIPETSVIVCHRDWGIMEILYEDAQGKLNTWCLKIYLLIQVFTNYVFCLVNK